MKTPKKEPKNIHTNTTTKATQQASKVTVNINDVKTKIDSLHRYAASELPVINNLMDNKAYPYERFLRDVTKAVTPIIVTLKDIPRFDLLEAKELIDFFTLLKILGFYTSSIEKHSQFLGAPPGQGLQQIAGLENLLLKLGKYLNHPARDSHYTEWIANADEATMLTFTGNSMEKFFNNVVNTQNTVHKTCCELLTQLADGTVSIKDEKASEILGLVHNHLATLYDMYQAFKHDHETGKPNMTADFFVRVFRQYLLPYPVGGEMVMGPNPTNIVYTPLLDYVLGTIEEHYSATIVARSKFMSNGEAEMLKAAMVKPSVFDKLLAEIGLDREAIKTISKTDLYYRLVQQPKQYFIALNAFREVQKMSAHISAYHFQLIMNYLVRASEMYSVDEMKTWPVKPLEGVGGKPHSHTKGIMDMRRKNVAIDLLLNASKHVHY